MTTPPPSGDVTYQVTAVQQGQYGEDAAGNQVPGSIVSFQLSTGASGQAFVPDTQFTPDQVEQMILAAARRLHAVSQLSGSIT